MIPNHAQFMGAIQDKKKVWVRFYSVADSGVVDRVCGPLEYGPGLGVDEPLNCYWVRDFATETLRALSSGQILELQVLGEDFDSGAAPGPPGLSSAAGAVGPVWRERGHGGPAEPISGTHAGAAGAPVERSETISASTK